VNAKIIWIAKYICYRPATLPYIFVNYANFNIIGFLSLIFYTIVLNY